MLLTTGPVNRDFVLGELTNWHLELLNNSNNNARITFTVYGLFTTFPSVVRIRTTTVELRPGEYTPLTIQTENFEHTIPVIDIPNNDILLTLYGRTAQFQEISGAVYPRNALVQLNRPLSVQGDFVSNNLG
jgi:hypothetical protein